MHTTALKDETGRIWWVFHNGDWSGNAHVRPSDAKLDEVTGTYPDEVTLPGFVLKNACRAAMLEELRSRIETAMDEAWKEGESRS